jgi:SnoaL-like domain
MGAVRAGVLGLAASACAPPVATAPPVAAPPATSTPRTEAAPAPAPSASPVERPSLAELARRARDAWMAAFKARDADQLARTFTEDACVKGPGHPPVCGRGAIADASRAAWARLPDVRVAWGRAWWTGDVLAVESAWSAEARGAYTLALCAFSVGGLIRDVTVYADARAFASAAAASPAKGRPFEGLPTTRETYASSGAPGEQVDLDLVRGTFTAPFLADDVELVDFAAPGSRVGKKYATRWVSERSAGLADARAEPTRCWAVDVYVLCEYEAKGARRGARSEAVTLHGAEVVQIDGGKVKRAWRYDDSLETAPAAASAPMFVLAVP